MYSRLLFFLILIFWGAGAFCQPLAFKLRPMEGYYIVGNHTFQKGINFLVISDERQFQRLFGTFTEKEDYPNFEFEHVLVIAMEPGPKQAYLSFEEQAMKAGESIEVYCHIRTERHKLTYDHHPIAVAAIPKYLRLRDIRFYGAEDKKLLKTIVIGR